MKPPRIASYDVFDTLITRIWAIPADLFLRVGRELGGRGLIRLSPRQWQRQRIDAERRARSRHPEGECTLDEIYRELATRIGWSLSQREQSREVELAAERRAFRPVKPGITALARRRKDRKICFVSGMYLPDEEIRKGLIAVGAWREGDRLYVSGTVGKSKRSGELYRHVIDRERTAAGGMVHSGDHPLLDQRVPQTLGLSTAPLPRGRLTPSEMRLAVNRGSEEEILAGSLASGAARLARLSAEALSEPARTFHLTGAAEIGPLVFDWVAAVLDTAVRQGITSLYFLARDGWIPWQIGRHIAAKFKQPVLCRYLLASRQAWHPAAWTGLSIRERAWLFEQTPGATLLTVGQRAGLEMAPFRQALLGEGLDADTPLTPLGAERLERILDADPVRSLLQASAREKRAHLLEYLEQEGFFTGRPAIVDLGWRGRLQGSLASALKAAGRFPQGGLHGFYLALIDPVPPQDGEKRTPHFPSPPRLPGGTALRHFVPLIETAIQAPHGSLRGYQQGPGGNWRGCFAKNPGKDLVQAILAVRAGALAFTRKLCLHALQEGVTPWPLAGAPAAAESFFCRPTFMQAASWGDLPFCEEQTGERPVGLAGHTRPGKLIFAVLRGGSRLAALRWPEGVVTRSPANHGVRQAARQLLAIRRRWSSWRDPLRREFR